MGCVSCLQAPSVYAHAITGITFVKQSLRAVMSIPPFLASNGANSLGKMFGELKVDHSTIRANS